MNTEIQIAQSFVLNFLFNKLPRRRVNLFGEELEQALADKFKNHWYPDQPFKGSAYRCLRITDPHDPVLNRAARESGNPLEDITENLPADLAIWIDPGEVSYRIGEKGSVQIIYSERKGSSRNGFLNHPSPINSVQHSQTPSASSSISSSDLDYNFHFLNLDNVRAPPASPPNPQPPQNNGNGVTYTAGMFARTKFGSTKLKTKYTHHKKSTSFNKFGTGCFSPMQKHQFNGGDWSNLSSNNRWLPPLNTQLSIKAQNDFINELFSSSSNSSSLSSSSSSSSSSNNEFNFEALIGRPDQSPASIVTNSFGLGVNESDDYALFGKQDHTENETDHQQFLQLAN